VRRARIAALIIAAVFPRNAAAQGQFQPSGFAVDDPVLRRIWAIGNDSSRLPRLAEVLFDSLGPRLTASPGMTAAQNWLIATYNSWGITARKEQYGTWRSWRRGTTHMSRERRDVFQPRPNGQPGAWPDCQQPQRATPPLAPPPAPSAPSAPPPPSAPTTRP